MSDRLSIAFLSHVASPRAPTGAERSLSLLAAGLRARDHRVAVVLPGPSAAAKGLAAAGVEVHEIRCRACWLTYYDPRPWPVLAAKWLRYAWPERAAARLLGFIERWGADVVHVNCLPHLRGARAAAASGRPVVWHVREILPPGGRRRWFAARLRRHATAVVAVSEATGEWVRAAGLGDRLHVVRNGVEIQGPRDGEAARERAHLGIPQDGVAIGWFGQLVPHKGALEFVLAAGLAAAEQPGIRFVMAGAGPVRFREQVARAIAAGGHADSFHLLPPQPDGERLVRACDVIALTTRTPDPSPRAVLEAMAAGKPVCAFRSGGTAEMVSGGETGLLVETGDVAGLGRAFLRLGREPGLREALGRAGARRASQEFSLARHLDRMESVFRGLRP